MDALLMAGMIVQNILIAFSFSMFLWRRSILSDIAEQTFISTSMAMVLVGAVGQIRANGITPLLNGKVLLLVPIALGILIYSQFFRKYAFFQRWSMAVVLGVGFGIVIMTSVETTILRNLSESVLQVTQVPVATAANNILMIIALFCTVSYFIFTRPRTGALARVQRFGRYFMMVYFGAVFGSTVMSRLGNYIAIIQTFLNNLGMAT